VVQENLDTLYGAVEDGALAIALPKFVRKELEGYLECGLLCHGFARLKCGSCDETRLVAFSCKGRGFCPARARHGSDERRSVSAGHRRAHRRPEADARSRTSVLAKSCAPSRCR